MVIMRQFYSSCIFTEVGRSFMHFTNLGHFFTNMDNTKIARLLMSMKCLIALVQTDTFPEGIEFLDYIEALPENPIKRKQKHLIFITESANTTLLQNRTGNNNINVHMINEGEAGLCYIIVDLNFHVFECGDLFQRQPHDNLTVP